MEHKRNVSECSICTGPEARRQEIDALLADGQESFSSIATITGVSRSTIYRHSRHAIDVPSGQESQPQQLYAIIKKLLDKAHRTGNLTAATELSGQLTRLSRIIETQEAAAPKAERESPWTNAIAAALGFNVASRDHDVCTHLLAWLTRNPNAPPLLGACVAFVYSALDKRKERELRPDVAEIIERFAAEIEGKLGVEDELEKAMEREKAIEGQLNRINLFDGQ